MPLDLNFILIFQCHICHQILVMPFHSLYWTNKSAPMQKNTCIYKADIKNHNSQELLGKPFNFPGHSITYISQILTISVGNYNVRVLDSTQGQNNGAPPPIRDTFTSFLTNLYKHFYNTFPIFCLGSRVWDLHLNTLSDKGSFDSRKLISWNSDCSLRWYWTWILLNKPVKHACTIVIYPAEHSSSAFHCGTPETQPPVYLAFWNFLSHCITYCTSVHFHYFCIFLLIGRTSLSLSFVFFLTQIYSAGFCWCQLGSVNHSSRGVQGLLADSQKSGGQVGKRISLHTPCPDKCFFINAWSKFPLCILCSGGQSYSCQGSLTLHSLGIIEASCLSHVPNII